MKFESIIQKNWYKISIVFILIFAFVLRFYNYENRWGLAYDQAHDALVARFALESFKIPLVGPFSSAGPFQTGGEWYWFLMAATAPYPYSVITPWIVMTLVYVLFVFLAIQTARALDGEKFGILIGVLSTISTAQIAQSTNLTNQSLLAITSLLAIWSVVNYFKKRKESYFFFLGLFVGLGFTIHLQGAALFLLILATLLMAIFVKALRKKAILLLILGIVIPFIPLIIFDLQNNFVNSKSMLQYYLVDQYKISFDVLGRRWLTYLTVFLPNAWMHILGGKPVLGGVIMVSLVLITALRFYKRKLSKEWIILIGSFVGIMILLRYVRTPLFDSFIVFFHPFVIFLTGFTIFDLWKRNILIGSGLLLLIILGSLTKDFQEINGGSNLTALKAKEWKENLTTQFPDQKFAIYDYQYKYVDKSLPLVLFLYADGRVDDKGRKIGLVRERLVDLESSSSSQLVEEGWSFANPSQVYKTTEEWYKNNHF